MTLTHHNSMLKKVAAVIAILVSLQGCVSGIAVGSLGVALIVNDPRTTATQLEDQTIEFKAKRVLAKDKGINQHSHVNVVSYNRTVLLIGQVPNQMLRDRAIKAVSDITNVTHVHNQLRIGNKTALITRTNDSALTLKVKMQLLKEPKLKKGTIKVITEHGEVFLMGLVTVKEGNLATDIARHVPGVSQVIKAFEYQ